LLFPAFPAWKEVVALFFPAFPAFLRGKRLPLS
jgi:hypothetical protein